MTEITGGEPEAKIGPGDPPAILEIREARREGRAQPLYRPPAVRRAGERGPSGPQ